MEITGLIKTSLIDYPGEIATVIFTPGCNFRCPYCHNRDLVDLGDNIYPTINDELYDHIEKKKDFLTGITITGGEPTLHEDIIDFIVRLKRYDLSIKLDTNGSNYMVIEDILEEDLIDYIAMDVKMGKKRYDEMTNDDVIADVMKSISLIKNSGIDYQFRTTVVPGLHTLDDISEIGELIEGSKCHYIQNFRPVNTLDNTYMERRRFSIKELDEFKTEMEKYVDEVKMRF